MIFAKKDKVILAVLRGRRNIKRAKDTLTDSEHPCEALHKNDEAKSAQKTHLRTANTPARHCI